MVISTGGELARLANDAGVSCWVFEHEGQPRAAIGYSFGQLLALVARVGVIPDPESELRNAVDSMRAQFEDLKAASPVAQNPAKRYAGQLVGRWVTVLGSGLLAPVARRWKGQISEVAKAWAQFEFLPEANHNTLAGILNPAELFTRHYAIFLKSPSEHPRNLLRSDLTRRAFMLEGIATDFVNGTGDTPMAHMWTCLHFGDYVSYYLAMAYEVDPTPIPAIEYFKAEMSAAG